MANIYDYDSRDILADVLNCGVLDVDFIVRKINEFELDFSDVKEYAKESFDRLDAPSIIHSTFELAGRNFLNEVKEYIVNNGLSKDSEDEENENEITEEIFDALNGDANDLDLDLDVIYDYELDIYVNYLDSFFNDGRLGDYDITDFGEENLQKFIIDVYDLKTKEQSRDEMLEAINDLSKEVLLTIVNHFEHYPSVTEDSDESEIRAYFEDEAFQTSPEKVNQFIDNKLIDKSHLDKIVKDFEDKNSPKKEDDVVDSNESKKVRRDR